ncbi:hypothetical protein GALMADRAFT_493336 [Galerina marginata CBS 339.88]|uniref:Zn(2)-C6 fungal-type domain-containing protein n=1 Tax=Galerina marginata (strain CBS 339.88) TaxID=685588 RepID=A0A067T9H4_GALM3|nr:hypothetical protein GALMADRAFT_493336 [Galerina marginata CBS 339.88]
MSCRNEETKKYKDYVRTILSPSQELAEFASRPIQTCVKCTRSNTTCVKGPLRFRCAPCSNKRRTCSWKEAFVVEFTTKHFGYSQEEAKRLYEEAGRSLKGSGDRDGGPSTKAGEEEVDEEGDGDNITMAPPRKNVQSKTAVPAATSASAPVGAARGTEQVVAGKKRILEEDGEESPSKIQKTGEAGTPSAPDGNYKREPYKKRPYRRHQSQTSVTLRIPVLPPSTSAPAAAAANAASPSGSIPNAPLPTQLAPATNYILKPCLEGPFTTKNLNSASTQTTSEMGQHVHSHNIGTQTESQGSTIEKTGNPVSHHVEALQKRNSSLTLQLEESDKHLKAQITVMQKALFEASTATLRVAILESELSSLKSRLVQKEPLLRDAGTQVDLTTGSSTSRKSTLKVINDRKKCLHALRSFNSA